MGDTLVPLEHGDVDGVHETSPALGALTGDQNMAAPAVHHELGEVVGLRDVVQDEQPASVGLTVVESLVDRLGRVRGIRPLRQAQRLGHARVPLDRQNPLLGLDVPDDVVVASVAVRELLGQQGLPHPAHALEDEGSGVLSPQLPPDALQQFRAAGEGRGAQRDREDRRFRPGKRGSFCSAPVKWLRVSDSTDRPKLLSNASRPASPVSQRVMSASCSVKGASNDSLRSTCIETSWWARRSPPRIPPPRSCGIGTISDRPRRR